MYFLSKKIQVLDTPASGLNQAFVDPVSLTVTAPTGGMGGSLKKSVFDLQPVMQPPNTATVVFPSLGTGNLGELEIVDNRPAGKSKLSLISLCVALMRSSRSSLNLSNKIRA